MNRFFYILSFIFLSIITERASAQTVYSISHSSTCVGSPVIFNSNVFETAQFPDQILWNFGDPASGPLNTARDIQQPTHIYTIPGSYIITLHVEDPGAGIINLTDTIIFVLPVSPHK